MSTSLDWDSLRARSLLPGGFGDDRVEIWPQLLHSTPSKLEPSMEEHRDERQIGLDTKRSFVFYPVDPPGGREKLQGELHTLLTAIFRQHPRLSYFQGYHDIITVLFLTLPPEMHLDCSVQLSLQRVRDSMGSTLNPVLGLLRVLNNLLHLADPSVADLLDRNTPLPYFALSNLLTLFSHDMPTLELIQHVFDYLLCRPPIALVYLAAALVISRKEEIKRLEADDEEGMVHSLLSGLPDITDEGEKSELLVSFDAEKPAREAEATDKVLQAKSLQEQPEDEDLSLDATVVSTFLDGDESTVINETAETFGAPVMTEKTEKQGNLEKVQEVATTASSLVLDEKVPSNLDEKTEDAASINGKEVPPSDLLPKSPRISQPQPRPVTPPPKRPQMSLSSLLSHADELQCLYPPTHTSIGLSKIMGPQSVMFTWDESPSSMPSNAEAEAMVDRPELVVLPEPEPEIPVEEPNRKRKRRKLHKSGRFGRLVVERKTMVAGAVLVLGVAMAVSYGMNARVVGNAHGGSDALTTRTWRKIGGWFRVVVAS